MQEDGTRIYRETRGYLSREEERTEQGGGGEHGGPPLAERNGGGARRMADGDGDERGNAVAVKRQPMTSPIWLLVCIYIYLLYTKQECITVGVGGSDIGQGIGGRGWVEHRIRYC